MMADLQHALKCARAHRSHVVVIVPADRHDEALDLLATFAGLGPFGGRSLSCPNGGCLTVMSAREEAFPSPFEVLFAGWGAGQIAVEEINRWRKAASKVLTRVG